MTPPETEPERPVGWLGQRERGAVWAIRFIGFLAGLLGRGPTRLVVRLVAAYYTLFDRTARSASRQWLERVEGRPVGLRRVYRHIATFAQVVLDRIFFARGDFGRFEIRRHGNEHLEALAREGRGAILLGAHLGSFEAMRAASQHERFPVSIVGHFENAAMVTAMLESLDPDFAGDVLHTGQDPVRLALALRDRIAEGGFVAILADRVGPNEKHIEVDFMGEPARFAAGPFLLASVLKSPIYLVFGLYSEPNRYDLYCEPFEANPRLPRGDRQAGLAALVSRYAQRLEVHGRSAPENWFNFFDFWEKPEA